MHGEYTRRTLLRSTVAAGAVALAGCIGGDDDDEDEGDTGTRIIDDFVLSEHTLSGEFPFRIVEVDTGELIVRYHGHGDGNSHWHRQPIELTVGEERSLELEIIDQQRERIPVDEDGFTFDIRRTDDTPEDVFEVSRTGDIVTFAGVEEGEGQFVIDLFQNEELEFTTTPCGVVVE